MAGRPVLRGRGSEKGMFLKTEKDIACAVGEADLAERDELAQDLDLLLLQAPGPVRDPFLQRQQGRLEVVVDRGGEQLRLLIHMYTINREFKLL